MGKERFYIGGLYGAKCNFFGTPYTPNNLFRKMGLEIVDSIERASRYVSFDVNPGELEQLDNSGFPVSARTLLRFEPSLVWPANYTPSYLSKYSRVIDIGRIEASVENCEFWPQFWDLPIDITNENQSRLDRIVVINSNKVSCSKGELYSLRKKAVYKIDSTDLYGEGWNNSTARNFVNWLKAIKFTISHKQIPILATVITFLRVPRNYHGRLEDKFSKLKEYRYSLVIENSFEVVTEKLFDSFVAGTFPIYVGPDLTKFGIPSHLFISSDANLTSIKNSIIRAKRVDLDAWRIDLQEWLNREETQSNWNYQSVFTRLISKIDPS